MFKTSSKNNFMAKRKSENKHGVTIEAYSPYRQGKKRAPYFQISTASAASPKSPDRMSLGSNENKVRRRRRNERKTEIDENLVSSEVHYETSIVRIVINNLFLERFRGKEGVNADKRRL